MRRLAPSLLVLGFALAAAGCGEEERGLIDQARADQLMAAVDKIEAACEAEDVAAAQAAVDEASAQVSELPRRVNNRLQANLREWLDHTSGRLERDCAPEEEVEKEAPTAEPTPTATETPEPTPTETPEPTPPPEEEEPPPPPEEEPPPPPEEEPPPEIDPGGGVPAPEVPGEGQ